GHRRFDGSTDGEIGLAGIVRVNAALQADLDRAALPRLAAAAHDFLECEVVGPPAQVRVGLALGEGAERAAVEAYVGVVDVAGDHIADALAAGLGAQRVGSRADLAQTFVAHREQLHELSLAQLTSLAGAIENRT